MMVAGFGGRVAWKQDYDLDENEMHATQIGISALADKCRLSEPEHSRTDFEMKWQPIK